MKISRSIWILLAVMPLFLMTSCVKENFDVPPVNVPRFTLPADATLISIMDLKARHTISGNLDSINDNVYITGIVIGNDEFGNIYKTLVIQDKTGGIELKLNKTSLYNNYKLGQRIYVKCQGLILGDYSGLIQLGSVYGTDVGQLAEVYIPEHIFKDSLPGTVPAPKVITVYDSLSERLVSTLVRFDGAKFEEPGQTYVITGETNSNRNLITSDSVITVRTSSYATFAKKLLPDGIGTVVAILGYYDGSDNPYQLTIRNITDVYGFLPDPNPTILNETFTSDPAWPTYSVASNKNWTWNSTYTCMVANNYLGDVAAEDWLFSPELDLTTIDSATLSFRTWSKYADAGMPDALTIWISSNYIIGNPPSSATWNQVTGTLCPYSASWTASGDIDISQYAAHQKIRIAWKYRSSGTVSGSASQWEVDAVMVKGKRQQ